MSELILQPCNGLSQTLYATCESLAVVGDIKDTDALRGVFCPNANVLNA